MNQYDLCILVSASIVTLGQHSVAVILSLSSFLDWVFIRIFGGKQATSYKAKWNREFTEGILGLLE